MLHSVLTDSEVLSMSLSNKNTEVKTDLKLIAKENTMERISLDIILGKYFNFNF